MAKRGRALVTGGAGLIGSHLCDLLVAENWSVRILDNLEPLTHPGGWPKWLAPDAERMLGDVRDVAALRSALDGVDTVFHLAAYGGSMPEIAKFVDVNSLGTARLLEIIRDERLPIRKVIVASSQVVYLEGAVECLSHGRQDPPRRSSARMRCGLFAVLCPVCGGETTAVPTTEEAPTGGEGVYALTKLDQERLVLNWSRQAGTPAVALRFPCTYGPRQSPHNPYTGVISIFANRLLSGLAPLVYEDGQQLRDLCHVTDVARACLLAATGDRLDGRAVNVGSGRPTAMGELAELVARTLAIDIRPQLPGLYRLGELRSLVPDITRIREAGFEAAVPLELGLAGYVQWLRSSAGGPERTVAAVEAQRRSGLIREVSPG